MYLILVLSFDGWIVESNSITPTVEFQAQAIRMPISYNKIVENGKLADVTQVNERIIITNMRGAKKYTGTADFIVNGYTQEAAGCYLINPETLRLPVAVPVKDLNNSAILQGIPQHIITLLFDDLMDSYERYKYDIYSDLVNGSYTIRWDDKIVIIYEGAKITLEYKDDRKETDGDSKFETLTEEWTGKNVEMMLNRYMEKIGKSLVFPMPDEMMK